LALSARHTPRRRLLNSTAWINPRLVFGLSHFRHAFETRELPLFGLPGQETRVMDNNPFDMPAIHI
jgi:hypothetical protein